MTNDEGKEESPKEEVVDVDKFKKELVNQEYSPNSQEDSNDKDFSSASLPLSSKNSKDKNTSTFSLIEEQLSPALMSELSRHSYKFTRYNPLQLTIAHCDEKKIFHAYVNYVKNDNNKDIDGSSIEYLKLTDVIIDAIPKQIIIFDNPIDRNRKLQIQFESKSTKRLFTIGPGTISSIVDELQNRNMIIKKAAAMDGLTAIIVHLKETVKL